MKTGERILFGWEVRRPHRPHPPESPGFESKLTLEQARTLRAHLARLAELCAGRCDDALAGDDYAAAADWYARYRQCTGWCRSLGELIHVTGGLPTHSPPGPSLTRPLASLIDRRGSVISPGSGADLHAPSPQPS